MITTVLILLAAATAVTVARSQASERSLESFADERRNLRHDTNVARHHRCRPTVHRFTRWAFQIPASKWTGVLAYWQEKRTKARTAFTLCTVRGAIRHVFGPFAGEALRVAYCESRYSVTAANGQYLGIFQMGSFARSRYGHSSTALGQTRAAYRYFVDSGRDWSPWACKP